MDIDSILYFAVGLIIFIFSIIGNKKKKPAPQQMVPKQKTNVPDLFDDFFDIKEEQEPKYQNNEEQILDQAGDYSFSGYESIENNAPERGEISEDEKEIISSEQKGSEEENLLSIKKRKPHKKQKINLKQAIIHQVILERRDEQF